MRTLPLFLFLGLLVACGSPQSESVSGQESSATTSGEGGETTGHETDPGESADTETGEAPESDGPTIVVSDAPCETDADCVPAGCCHAAACTNQANAPSCTDQLCTSDCRFGTLDCGGACLCQEGRCAARLSEPPAAIQDALQNTPAE